MLSERFWTKVSVAGDDECWNWTACKNRRGYGMLRRPQTRSNYLAHRLSYEMNIGPIPDGFGVLHTCDNPSCVNPRHLFIGDHSANMADMWAKGRHRRLNPTWLAGRHAQGEKHGSSRLTESDVVAIISRISAGERPTHIARDYPVGPGAIHDIKHGRTWVHVPRTTIGHNPPASSDK